MGDPNYHNYWSDAEKRWYRMRYDYSTGNPTIIRVSLRDEALIFNSSMGVP